ncbi:MAG TPA: universal stress protein [Candidatus Acidoferrales bacterium]|nr:universal stress protein [Candidatus Acidoferrales bacterium]
MRIDQGMPISRILVPVDGSDVAARALDFAVERAKLHGASLGIAFSVNRSSIAAVTANPYGYADPAPLLEALEEEAGAVLRGAKAVAERAGVGSDCAKLDGVPSAAILAYAEQYQPDIIVMGTHGRAGLERFALGSTAEGVVRAARVPVFTIDRRTAAHPVTGNVKRALVAIDGSPASDLAFDFACAFARVEQTELELCGVVEPSGGRSNDLDRAPFVGREIEERVERLLDERRVRAADASITARVSLLRGSAAGEILAKAETGSAQCVFAGTHGRAGIPRFLLGSVAESLLRSSPVPVCTVRHR